MIKYVLKTNGNYYGNGYIKEFYNNYGACDDFHVSNNIFDATIYDTIDKAKNGIKYCLDVIADYNNFDYVRDNKSSKKFPKIWLDIFEVELTEKKIDTKQKEVG